MQSQIPPVPVSKGRLWTGRAMSWLPALFLLVVGRTPMSEKGDGRDHNPYGFTMWLAGGGVQGGQTIGTTDDIGMHAALDRLHVQDLHATILYLMGLDNMRLEYRYMGRPERPTQNEGEAFRRITGV